MLVIKWEFNKSLNNCFWLARVVHSISIFSPRIRIYYFWSLINKQYGCGGKKADHKYQGTVKVLYHLYPKHPTPEYRNLNPGVWSSVCVCVCARMCMCVCLSICDYVSEYCILAFLVQNVQNCSFLISKFGGIYFLLLKDGCQFHPQSSLACTSLYQRTIMWWLSVSPCFLWPNSWNLSYPNPLPVCSSRYFITLTFLFFPLPLRLSKMMGYTLRECECKEIQYIAYYSLFLVFHCNHK